MPLLEAAGVWRKKTPLKRGEEIWINQLIIKENPTLLETVGVAT